MCIIPPFSNLPLALLLTFMPYFIIRTWTTSSSFLWSLCRCVLIFITFFLAEFANKLFIPFISTFTSLSQNNLWFCNCIWLTLFLTYMGMGIIYSTQNHMSLQQCQKQLESLTSLLLLSFAPWTFFFIVLRLWPSLKIKMQGMSTVS